MSPLILWNCRPLRFAALLAAPLVFPMPGDAGAAECRCEAHFELREPSKGEGRPVFDTSFKPDIPVDHFSAGLGQGAGTMNGCRRQAQHRAHSCMSKVYDNRLTPDNEPGECSTSRGIHGSVPYDIKWGIERSACQGSSPIAHLHNAIVSLYRRTHGGTGCGDDLKTVKSVFVDDYEVDCLAIRHREKLGTVAESQIEGIDRPGSNLAEGATAGDGSVGACKAACNLASYCKAWTWVPPGIQGSQSKCWLKSSVPWHKVYATSKNMVSGTKQHNSQ
jgi:hypothetical protein